MFPPATDSEDPTSQIAWPNRRQPRTRGNRSRSPVQRDDMKPVSDGQDRANGEPPAKKHLSMLNMIALTISMAGAQIAWTVELGYGTPFLLNLGLKEHLTSLVWLAGPISGLIAQPLIGAISDSSTSRFRRRYWVVTSTIVLIIATCTLAYATSIAAILVDIFGGTQGRWDPRWKSLTSNTAIILAVVSFYLLDFALNALQGSLRSLLLDITPGEQLASANAWHGRMTHAGNIIGFTFGFLDLAGWKILRPLGGDQFRKVCVVAVIILVITVWITCSTQHERPVERDFTTRESKSRFADVLRNIVRALGSLPRPVRRVCYVQICAFMGWFPFLFYGTTWVGQIMAIEIDADPDPTTATRAGEFALLIYSFVAVVAGTILPWLAARDRRLLKQIDLDEAEALDEDEEVDMEIVKIRDMVRQWKSEAARQGRPLKLPRMPFMLRNIWTAALVLFGLIMMSTFFVRTVTQATVAISLLGICWAVACWVPFAIIMEFLKEMDENAAVERRNEALARQASSGPSIPRGRPLHTRVLSTPDNLFRQGMPPTERTQLIRRHSMMGRDIETDPEGEIGYVGPAPVAGGTILGIHNLAIVFPQFLIALVSTAIFKLADARQDPNGPVYAYYGKSGVSWVMRFGGLCAFVGAAISRRVPPTKTEKQMRGRLAEMREDEETSSP